MKKLLLSACILPVALAGCVVAPDVTSTAYVQASTYEKYSCVQLNRERSQVLSQVYQRSNQQLSFATNNTVMLDGPVIYWPEILALAAQTGVSDEFAGYKDKYDALTLAGVNNGCLSPGT